MGRPSKYKQHPKAAEPAGVSPAAQAVPESTPPSESRPVGSAPTEEPETITLRLDEKGCIREMRDETQERLRKALEVSDLGPGFEPPPSTGFVDEALAGRMLDGLAAAESLVFSKAAKVPYGEAAKVMRFDGDERKTLAPPTAALLNQYAGPWLARHGTLVEFGVKFAAIEASKLDRVVALAREHQKKRNDDSGQEPKEGNGR